VASAAEVPKPQAALSAAEIVDKNVAARGGLEAWRAVQTMTLTGKVGAGGNQRAAVQQPGAGGRGSIKAAVPARPAEEVRLPFVMELKRPRKTRFELQFAGQTATQVYDGANGWKVRPYLAKKDAEPFTAEELKNASLQSDLDGPLVDYVAKGTKVELVGTDKVENRDCYKVKMTMKDGQVTHVWIDAQTFLETKIEGQPRKLDGTDHPVETWFRDYRLVDHVRIPFTLETKVLPVTRTALGFRDPPVPPETTLIEKVEINPKLDDVLFGKPETAIASNLKK
jgi:hypothetical protein